MMRRPTRAEHAADWAETLIAEGHSPAAARHRARAAFGLEDDDVPSAIALKRGEELQVSSTLLQAVLLESAAAHRHDSDQRSEAWEKRQSRLREGRRTNAGVRR